MWKNHFKVATRLIIRQRLYAVGNIFNLSIGIAISFLLMMYVRYELSFDQFHENAQNIYRVNAISFNPEENFYRASAPAPLAKMLSEDFPEVLASTKLNRPYSSNNLVKANGQEYYETAVFTGDEGFFRVFSFDLLYGDETMALNQPGTIVLSQAMARKYFGRDNVVGEVINYENRLELTITGVLNNIPDNSSLNFNFIIANRTPGLLYNNWQNDWGSSNAAIYTLLREGSDPARLEERFPEIVERYIRGDLDEGEEYVMSLQKLSDLHLNPHVAPERVWSVSNKKYVIILPVVGLLVLLIATANHVNLSMARATDRLREVGVRKLMGSLRSQLVGQFLAESLLVAFVGLVLAFFLSWWALPSFNTITDVSLGAGQLFSVSSVLSGLLIWLILGLAAGIYPALILSGIKPLLALGNRIGTVNLGRAGLRNALLTLQFVIALCMVVAVFVVNQQMHYINNKSLGFNGDQVIYFTENDRAFWNEAGAFKNELAKYPDIAAVSFSSGIPGRVGFGSTAKVDNDSRDFEINHIMVDHDFMSLYDLQVVDGRGFDVNIPTDETKAYLLNETAVKSLGWQSPLNQQLRIWGNKAPVIGVIGDFHFESMKNPIGPLALHFGARRYGVVSIKINEKNFRQTIDFIKEVWHAQVPQRPFQYRFVDSRFESYYEEEQRFAAMTDISTGLGLLLALTGLLSLMAFLINKRSKEIGIRRVLGAGLFHVLKLFVNKIFGLFLIAFLVAIPLSYYGLNQWLNGFAYRVNLSVFSFGLAGISLIILILLTVLFQVKRAILSNTAQVLRTE